MKLIEIVILRIVLPSLLASACFGTVLASLYNFFYIPLFGLGVLTRVKYPKRAFGSFCKLNPI